VTTAFEEDAEIVRANPDARSLALQALQSLERRRSYSDAALDALLARHSGLSSRDRGLLLHLVYGVLRWRNRLDAHLERASERPLARVHPKVLDLLRLGAYQLLYLDRVPDRAAIFETVELARSSGVGHTAGFVNAVLRKVAALGPELPLPDEPAARLSLLFGCPEWLAEAWLREHGPQGAERLCRAGSQIPTLMLRIDPGKIGREEAVRELAASGLEAGPAEWAPEGVWVEGAGDPRSLPLVARNAAVVQGQASQLISHLVAPQPGWRLLDACAAPGLKTTHLASLLGGTGEIVALDLHSHRSRLVEELAKRLGAPQIRVETGDARQFRCTPGSFDAVLVDAPCSGLGVLDRNPEAKWRRTPDELSGLAELQQSILANLAEAVRPGGLLVYVTCTTLAGENEDVVDGFLSGRPDYRLAGAPEGPVPWEGLFSSRGFFRTYPSHVGEPGSRALAGFFAARLRRLEP
jgi:16S rRNA (cytosine967-C5)-methyltransferase